MSRVKARKVHSSLDRHAARNANFVLVASDRIAVLAREATVMSSFYVVRDASPSSVRRAGVLRAPGSISGRDRSARRWGLFPEPLEDVPQDLGRQRVSPFILTIRDVVLQRSQSHEERPAGPRNRHRLVLTAVREKDERLAIGLDRLHHTRRPGKDFTEHVAVADAER